MALVASAARARPGPGGAPPGFGRSRRHQSNGRRDPGRRGDLGRGERPTAQHRQPGHGGTDGGVDREVDRERGQELPAAGGHALAAVEAVPGRDSSARRPRRDRRRGHPPPPARRPPRRQAAMPLATSATMTTAPHFLPRTPATLAAPGLPVPTRRMSTRPLVATRVTMSAEGRVPMR